MLHTLQQELNAYLKALKPYYYFVEPLGLHSLLPATTARVMFRYVESLKNSRMHIYAVVRMLAPSSPCDQW